MSGVFKPWREREAEGDTSAQLKRQRAAADEQARYQETGTLSDMWDMQAAQDDADAYGKED